MTEEEVGGEAGARSGAEWTKADLLEALKAVVDPELHMSIVDLGLVYDVQQQAEKVFVEMTLTSPGCPYGPYILHGVKHAILPMEGVEDVEVEVVWDPPWGPDKMSEEVRLELGFDV